MENQYVSSSESLSGHFVMPPPLSPDEPAKTLGEWFKNQSKLCDSITPQTICIFRLFRTPDKNYAIYLAFAKHSQDSGRQFEYVSAIGNSFKIPGADSQTVTPDQIIQKISSEFHSSSKADAQAIGIFKKAELVTVTYDNYHFTKLLPE
jgi:hypothetical protein